MLPETGKERERTRSQLQLGTNDVLLSAQMPEGKVGSITGKSLSGGSGRAHLKPRNADLPPPIEFTDCSLLAARRVVVERYVPGEAAVRQGQQLEPLEFTAS